MRWQEPVLKSTSEQEPVFGCFFIGGDLKIKKAVSVEIACGRLGGQQTGSQPAGFVGEVVVVVLVWFEAGESGE